MQTIQTMMKTSLFILAVMGVLFACSTAAFAGSQTTVLLVFDGCPACNPPAPATDLTIADGGIHAHAHGYVTFKTARGGGWDVTVQLWDAAPGFPYFVKSNGKLLGTLTTNTKGNGALQFHVTPAEAGSLSPYISIFSSLSPYIHLFYSVNRMY